MANPPSTGSSSGGGSHGSSGSSGGSSSSHASGGHGEEPGSGASLTISEEGVEAGMDGTSVSVGESSVGAAREFELWSGTVAPIPTAIPGVFITLTPAVTGKVNGSVNFEHATEVTVGGSITGSLMVGLEGGAPPIASVYLRGGPVLTGTLSITMDRTGVKSATGRIDLDMNARIGVQVQHVFDFGVDLGSARMFSFIGLSYERGRTPSFQRGTFELGGGLRRGLDFVRSAIDRAVALGSSAVSTISNAYHGARDYVAGGLSDAYNALTSW
ncbi:MAG: hypothetical protein U1F43_02065 [Myxococcota bacterium]